MNSIAPGKIILAGEHAVVYGKTALVMAVNRYAKTSIEPSPLRAVTFEISCNKKVFHLSYSLEKLFELHQQLNLRYQRFLDNKLPINEVLKNSMELIPFAFYLVIHEHDITLSGGLNIQMEINIPLGCGMGSSAATALSVLRATTSYFQIDLGPQDYFLRAMQCERLCHGIPSGIDPFVSLHGGFIRFQEGKTESLPLPEARAFLVVTGRPSSSTGACVMHVKRRFAKCTIWEQFESVGKDLYEAFAQNNYPSILKGIRKNHQLLTEIGVVPEKVKKFIFDIEKEDGAAKISGAGSVTGENAGAVLVYSEFAPTELCTRYGYKLIQVESDKYGLRLL